MQKMRRGAVTLPGLSTVAVGAATPCEITGEGREEAESENEEIIWGRRGEAREAEKQRAMMGKFNKSGVNKKTFSAFWWTPGNDISISFASALTQPSLTHTHQFFHHQRPHRVDQKLQHSGAEEKSSLRLAATCGELGSIDQRRWLSVLPPVEGGYRTAYTQTHMHKQVTWRCTQLTGCFDTELKADLAGWSAGFTSASPLLLSLLPYLYPFTQHSEIRGCTACHSSWETTCA